MALLSINQASKLMPIKMANNKKIQVPRQPLDCLVSIGAREQRAFIMASARRTASSFSVFGERVAVVAGSAASNFWIMFRIRLIPAWRGNGTFPYL